MDRKFKVLLFELSLRSPETEKQERGNFSKDTNDLDNSSAMIEAGRGRITKISFLLHLLLLSKNVESDLVSN